MIKNRFGIEASRLKILMARNRLAFGGPETIGSILGSFKNSASYSIHRTGCRWRMTDFDYTQSQDVDQVMGHFFIRRNVFDELQGLERFSCGMRKGFL